ncbi:MAG: DUF2332 domain-containing protein [Parvularculaceae bacterium]
MNTEAAAAYFEFFAREAANGGSPLYERLSLLIARDEGLQELAAGARPEQPRANILFGAVHFLLLGGADHPLKDYYPNIGGLRGADSGADAAFRDFCENYEMDLRPIIASRITNTNEVGRSAVLAPGFARLADETGLPLALVEIGPSAGLNLNFDRYAYRYADGDGAALAEHWVPSPVTISSHAKASPPPLPERPPTVASRTGLELNPVNLANEADRRWLKALVWPERAERFERLEAALNLGAQFPPPIRAGDALALLPETMDALPEGVAPCIYHSLVTYQFTDEMRACLDALLLVASEKRPIWRLSMEMEGMSGRIPLTFTRYEAGEKSPRELAECGPHGLWVNWF